jgi:anaerobic selenocysteine-containing dehydrogenase
LFSESAKKDNLSAMPRFIQPTSPNVNSERGLYPLRLISAQHPYHIHSQFAQLSLGKEWDEVIQINPGDAQKRRIAQGDWVLVYNEADEQRRKAIVSDAIPLGVVLVFQGDRHPVNRLVVQKFTDMGRHKSKSQNVAFYSTFVECKQDRG